MPYQLRTFRCAGCGAQVQRRAPAGAGVRCISCAIDRSADNARQMIAGSGEYYQRWAAGMRRAARRVAGPAAPASEVECARLLGRRRGRVGTPSPD